MTSSPHCSEGREREREREREGKDTESISCDDSFPSSYSEADVDTHPSNRSGTSTKTRWVEGMKKNRRKNKQNKRSRGKWEGRPIGWRRCRGRMPRRYSRLHRGTAPNNIDDKKVCDWWWKERGEGSITRAEMASRRRGRARLFRAKSVPRFRINRKSVACQSICRPSPRQVNATESVSGSPNAADPPLIDWHLFIQCRRLL